MTAPDLALAETDPAGFVLAVADLRERRALRCASYGPLSAEWYPSDGRAWINGGTDHEHAISAHGYGPLAEYLAAEQPAVALAEVALWRAVVEQYQQFCEALRGAGSRQPKRTTVLLSAAVAAAKAYLGEPS